MKNSLKKFTAVLLSIFLILGATLAISFLSLSGELLLYPQLLPAILSFVLAGIIEGEVYKQNIWQGMTKIFTTGYFKRSIILQRLDEFLDPEFIQDSEFLSAYQRQKKYVEKLRKLEEKKTGWPYKLLEKLFGYKPEGIDPKIRRRNEKRLQRMEDYFINYIFNENPHPIQKLDAKLDEKLGANKQKIYQEVKNKIRGIRASWILSILGGAGSGAAALHTSRMGIMLVAHHFGWVIAGVGLTSIVYAGAILAALAYTIMVYNAISDMIANDTLQKWFDEFSKKLKKPIGANSCVHALKVIGLFTLAVIVVGLAIFAVVASAGTAWYLVKKGVLTIPYVVKGADYVRDATVPAMAATSSIFSIKNSFESVQNFLETHIGGRFHALWEQIKATKAKENWPQFWNPFRILALIISIPFKIVIMAGHLLSMAVTNDRLGNIKATYTTPPLVGNEFLNDYDYIFPDEHDHKHHHHQGEGQQNAAQAAQKKKHHDHDHHHSDIPGVVLKIILSPLYFLAAVWDWGFGHLPKSTEIQRRDFKTSLKRSFGIETKHKSEEEMNQIVDNRPQLSTRWYQHELLQKIDKKIEYCKSTDCKSADKERDLARLIEAKYKIKQANIDNEYPRDQNDSSLFKTNKAVFFNDQQEYVPDKKIGKFFDKITAENSVYNFKLVL